MRERPKYNYHDLLSYLSRGRNKNDPPADKSALRVIRQGGEPCVKLHSTTIARFHENGTITLNCGGWEDSSVIRQCIGDVTGASISTIAQHLKRRFVNTTRLYVVGMPNGVPYADGCIISRGSAVWHPDMAAQGVTDIRELREDVRVVRKERKEVVEYYAARRALVKKMRPIMGFIDEWVLAETPTPIASLDWLTGVLFNEIEAEDMMGTACALIDLGKPTGWGWGTTRYEAGNNAKYLQMGITDLVGSDSWVYFESAGLVDVESVRCMEA